MRVKQSRSHSRMVTPAPLPQRRRSKRRASTGSRGAPPPMVVARSDRPMFDPIQWLSFVAVGLISIALIILIWNMTGRTIEDQTTEFRARADQTVRSVASVLAREVEDELRLVDQSLAIIQDAWNKDSDQVDLGAWRKQALALTDVATDIFIANDRGMIVQGTLPQSVGQGFGSAYVTYTNGGLEIFNADGTKNPDGKIAAGADHIEARQFLTYIARPLARPKGWFIGASYRSEGITKLFAAAKLGSDGLIGIIAVKRGGLQAIVGPTAQVARMDIARSELVEQVRKNDEGVWTGESPTDGIFRVIAYRHIPGRDMAVAVGMSLDTAMQPLSGLAALAHVLATVATLIVLVIAGAVIWTVATARTAKLRRREQERNAVNLANTRQELEQIRARTRLTEAEAATLMTSPVDGVARLDEGQRLRQWNQRFLEFAGVPLDQVSSGVPIEDLLRRQASAGLFGDVTEPEAFEQEVATRLTILDATVPLIAPPAQLGPNQERVTMHVRGMADGGYLVILASPESARLAALPPLPGDEARAEPETAETTEW